MLIIPQGRLIFTSRELRLLPYLHPKLEVIQPLAGQISRSLPRIVKAGRHQKRGMLPTSSSRVDRPPAFRGIRITSHPDLAPNFISQAMPLLPPLLFVPMYVMDKIKALGQAGHSWVSSQRRALPWLLYHMMITYASPRQIPLIHLRYVLLLGYDLSGLFNYY